MLGSRETIATVPAALQATPTRAAVVVTLLAVLASVWYVEGRGRWRSLAAERLLYGVPWGTLATLGVVVGFYLLVQGGAQHWDEPLVVPFVTWSYFYPLGTLTAGIAHSSPEHLVGNVAVALVLGSIAEYAWSHYPAARPSRAGANSSTASANADAEGAARRDGDAARRDGDGVQNDENAVRNDGGLERSADAEWTAFGPAEGVLARPWVRAVVLFPAAVLGVSILTSIFSIGPSLGFSGAVFALAGFAAVNYPIATVVGVLAASALRTLFGALTEPVVRGTVETGPPAPPSWAGIAVQAHALGFLLGVLAGLLVVYATARRPVPARVFLATLLFGAVQGLWLVVYPGGQDVYLLYRGLGVVLLLLATLLVTATVVGLRSEGEEPGANDGAWASSLPRPDTVRRVGVLALVLVTVLLALPAPFVSAFVVDDAGVPDGPGVTAGDYTVTYVENEPSGRHLPFGNASEDFATGDTDGVVVASAEREVWTVAVRQRVLEHDGNATVTVGAPGWRETIDVERPAWDVTGAGTAYAVDLVRDGERTRSFRSDPRTARPRIDGQELVVRPDDDGFAVELQRDGRSVAATSIPAANDSTSFDGLTVATEPSDGTEVVVVRSDAAEVVVAERVTYGDASSRTGP